MTKTETQPLLCDRDDVPAWVRLAGDTGWLRDMISVLRKSSPPTAAWTPEYILNLELLVADLDELRGDLPALAEAMFEPVLQSLIDSGQVRRLPNGKLTLP